MDFKSTNIFYYYLLFDNRVGSFGSCHILSPSAGVHGYTGFHRALAKDTTSLSSVLPFWFTRSLVCIEPVLNVLFVVSC